MTINFKKHIDELKKMTVTKDLDFSTAFTYFFDHLGENQAFFDQSQRFDKKTELFHVILTPVIQYYGDDVKITSLCLCQVKEFDFIHGAGALSNGIVINLYFFNDIQAGIAAATDGSMTNFFRITFMMDETKRSKKDFMSPPTLNKTYN